jgi:putative ATP-dependent endonuclease of the OLD family
MKLRTITVENFRGIKKAQLHLANVTVLIGENNTGKTTFLDAIRLCLGRQTPRKGSQFEDYDYHLDSPNAVPATAAPITITFDFAEDKPEEWSNALVQALGDVVVVHPDDRRHVTLRVSSKYEKTINDFQSDWRFLDPAGNPLKAKAGVFGTLQQLRPIFYLAAVREAARDFTSRSPFWGPFLRSPTIPEKTRQELEQALAELNEQIIDAQAAFKDIRKVLGKAPNIVALGEKDTVSIDAVPGRVFDLLARTEVSLQSTLGTKLPLARHGAGTQSLAVMLLFEAFLQSQLKGAYDALSEPILALEEPEAHLHPCAVRSLWNSLASLAGQLIVSTHSGDLLAEAPLEAVRRIHRSAGSIEVRALKPNTLSEDDQRKIHLYLRESRGELLFARRWLLVEGQTEYWVLTMSADQLGIHLAQRGVRIIQYRNVEALPFVKVANDFGIDWLCLIDGDDQGKRTAKSLGGDLAGKPGAERIVELPAPNMERFICDVGFGGVYEKGVAHQKKHLITTKLGDPQYWDQVLAALSGAHSKEWRAIQAMGEIEKAGPKKMPGFLRDLVKKLSA